MKRQANSIQQKRPVVAPWAFECLLGVGLLGLCLNVMAQETIYRCGLEYTNAPKDASLCQPLAEQNIVVIPGLRPQTRGASGAVENGPPMNDGRTKTEPARPMAALQSERDAQARAILAQELEKMKKQHLELVQEYNQGEPVKLEAEIKNQAKYQDRVAMLKAAVARTERDMDSLQRELARYATAAKGVTP